MSPLLSRPHDVNSGCQVTRGYLNYIPDRNAFEEYCSPAFSVQYSAARLLYKGAIFGCTELCLYEAPLAYINTASSHPWNIVSIRSCCGEG